MLLRFFARADIRAQLRDDVDARIAAGAPAQLHQRRPLQPLLFEPAPVSRAQVLRELEQRLDLFYRSVLK